MTKIMEEILQSALGHWADKGYSLTEDEDFLYLHFEGKQIAQFNATKATYQVINDTISQHYIEMGVNDVKSEQM